MGRAADIDACSPRFDSRGRDIQTIFFSSRAEVGRMEGLGHLAHPKK